jgi:hypothetical protein
MKCARSAGVECAPFDQGSQGVEMFDRVQLRTVVLACLLPSLLVPLSAQAPHIFYSDLVSGPSSGGEGNQGAIVTLTGSAFGALQGKSEVHLAGSPLKRVLVWTDRKISFQIGAGAHSGDLTVTTDRGSSNVLPFTVRSGNIYFVANDGHDGASGSRVSPWRTIPHAVVSMRPGDITYVLDEVHQTTTDNYHAALSIQSSGQADRPIALVVYPGASATIGDPAGPEFGLRTPSIHGGPFSNWVIAGFTIRGANTALRLDAVSGWRIINNDLSCPTGDGAAGCLEVSDSSAIALLGNSVHDTGKPGGSKRYQSVYFTTDSNHIEIGWNRIFHNNSCRGIQFHSSPVSPDSGFNQYDLLIHDNQVSDQVCDGINLATIDPSKGRVAIYNNLIFHVGVGPSPHDGDANYACISSPGIVNRGTAGSGEVEIFNNTLFDCGSIGGPSAGALAVGPRSPDLLLTNNIIDQHGAPYLTPSSVADKVHGSNNLWWGAGSSPRGTSGNLEADPRFSSGTSQFALSAKSPARHASHDCRAAYDIAGNMRKAGDMCSLGAYE